MKTPPWFLPPLEAARVYAKQLADMRFMERLAKMIGRQLRPKQ